MKNLSLTLSFILIAASFIQGSWTQDQSDSPCSELIQQGLYDYYSQATASSSYSQFAEDFCNEYDQYSSSQNASDNSDSSSTASASGQSSSKSGGGGFSILGLFGIGAHGGSSQANFQGSSDASSVSRSSSSSQISALGQFLCGGSDNDADTSDIANSFSAFIDPNALNSYDECLQLNSAGLKVTTTVRSDQEQVTIQLAYIAPIGTQGGVNVTGIVISPSGSWECAGPLENLAQNSHSNLFTSQSVSMSCERNVSSTPSTIQNQSVYAGFSSIIVFTTAGTVTRDFVPIYASPPLALLDQMNSQISQLQQNLSNLADDLPNEITTQVAALNILKTENGLVFRSENDVGYTLNQHNNGELRTDCTSVTFPTPFSSTPNITTAIEELSDFDNSDQDQGTSLFVYSQDVTSSGFLLCAKTHEVINAYATAWIAIG